MSSPSPLSSPSTGTGTIPGADASLPVIGSPTSSCVSRIAFIIAALTALHMMMTSVGMGGSMGWGWKISVVLVLGAIARQVLPVDPYRVMMFTGVLVLALWKPVFALYELPFVLALYLLRHRPRAFFALLILGGIVLPKMLRFGRSHQPMYWSWVNQSAMAHILLVSALWWAERWRNRVRDATLPQWMTLYASPTNPLNPLNFGPVDMWRRPEVAQLAAAQTLLLIGIKGTTLWIINTHFAGWLFKNQSFEALAALSWGPLWSVVALNYFYLTLYLSGTADVAVMILRVFGWKLEHPYRWALLAWNPVELWRRWSIYNRKLLLKLVYFPLGGGNKRRYLNVMLTFLASALVLHTGWFGSVYWVVGKGGWRDQSVYFLLQGVAVCACLFLWQAVGKDPQSDRALRFSGTRILGTIGTQAYSALVHIVVLAPKMDWGDRWRLMGRCLGLDLD